MKARVFTERNGPITNSIKVPSFIVTVIMDVKLPRIFAGEISPKYIGIVEKVIPIANPDINLDMYSSCEAENKLLQNYLKKKIHQVYAKKIAKYAFVSE